jgi:hypothetical protein
VKISPFKSTLFIILALVICQGCSVKKKILQNELQSLKRRIAACSDLQQELQTNPNPDVASDFGVFIPATLIRDTFAGFVGEAIEVPTTPATKLTLKEFTIAFGCDAATVDIAVEAERKGVTLRLSLEATAMLMMDPDPATGVARVLLNVEEVKTAVRLPWHSFALRGVVRDLVTLAFIEYSKRLPVGTIPLRQALQLTVPDSRMSVSAPAGSGIIDGILSVAGLTRNGVLQIRRTMFLEDGIYVFLTLH